MPRLAPMSVVPLLVLSTVSLAAEEIDFAKDVQPILAAHCVQCHGIDRQESGLRLDHRVPARRGGDSGPAFVAGDPAKSALIARVTSKDDAEVMPPREEGVKRLSAEQIDVLKRWVTEGAAWSDDGVSYRVKSDHWGFQPIARPATPTVRNEAWVRGEIDRFVLARLEAAGIEPSPEANRVTLIRRLYYDLVGLPPDPADVDAFVDNGDPRAYEELVDRLLASEHFGERWGRHWLDMARYADSDGYEKDRPRPHAWKFRDWVIDAVNRDQPFDEFTIEQLAGDLLPEATPDQRLATAFHRQTLTNTEGGADQEQFRVEAVFDRVETTGTVWLGLTVGCARCHSHKYDPLSQAGYYELFAFFDNGDELTMEVPTSPEALAKYSVEKAAHDAKRRDMQAELVRIEKAHGEGLAAWEDATRAAIAREAGNVVRRHELEFTRVDSLNGQKLARQADGSYLGTAAIPAVDTTFLEFATPAANVTGFRLEVLTDDSLGANGPGRTVHGNFVLTRFRVLAIDGNGKDRELAIATANADFSQKGWDVSGTLSNKAKTGWGISPRMGKPHWAEFALAEPLPSSATHLRVELEQKYGDLHVIGRFRLQALTGSEAPVPVPDEVRAILAVEPARRTPQQAATIREHHLAVLPEVQAQREAIAKFDDASPARPYMPVGVIGERTKSPRTTHVLRRGDFLQPLDTVEPAAFAVLPPMAARNGGPPDRLDLAHWLMAEEHPLVARVAVNHVWSHLFGRGLVKTMNDFGTRGELPTHPELLDWLATEYRRLGWSRKTLIREIVTSSTYRQASRHRPELADVDAQNLLLHRQNRFRVEAEIVRDLHLAASGLLAEQVGGPSVFPPLPADVADLSYANNFKWTTSQGSDRYRRGMYTFFKRTAPHPNLTTFDCPDSNTTSVARAESNTPLQALILLNNEVFVESSRHLAGRVLQSDHTTDADRLTYAFRLCVAREPTADELAAFTDLLEAGRSYYVEHPEAAETLTADHAEAGVAAAENAAWIATCRMVSNMDEFITRE